MSEVSERYIYRVLWLEDELGDIYKRQAMRVDVDLVICRTGEEATAKIDDSKEHFDGAILDVKGVRQEGEMADGHGAIGDVFRELYAKRPDLPVVVYSGGAAGGLQNFEEIKKGFTPGVEVFVKGESGIKDVCIWLIERIKDKDRHIVQSRHAHLFNFMRTEDELRPYESELLKFLGQAYFLKRPSDEGYDKDPFIRMRKILEGAFAVCSEKGLLPDTLVTEGKNGDNVGLRACSSGLAGDGKGGLVKSKGKGGLVKSEVRTFKFSKGVIHPVMGQQLRAFIECVGSQGHRQGAKNFEPYLESVPQSSLIGIHTFILADFLSWLGRYLKKHPGREANQELWSEVGKEESRVGECANVERTYNGSYIRNRGDHGTFTSSCGTIEAFLSKKFMTAEKGSLEEVEIKETPGMPLKYGVVDVAGKNK